MLAYCKECDRKIDGAKHGEYQYHDKAEGPPKKLALLNCPRCMHAIVVEQIEHWGGYWSEPKTVYPNDLSGLSEEIPEALRDSFNEAAVCFNASSFNAAAIMCRRTLEGVCADLGIKKRSLAASLAALGEEGHIDGSMAAWANALRVAGNEAAHDVKSSVSRIDSQDLLEFTEAILDYVYVFKRKFEAFQARRVPNETPEQTPVVAPRPVER